MLEGCTRQKWTKFCSNFFFSNRQPTIVLKRAGVFRSILHPLGDFWSTFIFWHKLAKIQNYLFQLLVDHGLERLLCYSKGGHLTIGNSSVPLARFSTGCQRDGSTGSVYHSVKVSNHSAPRFLGYIFFHIWNMKLLSMEPLLGNEGVHSNGSPSYEGESWPNPQPELYRNRSIIKATGAKYHLLPGWDPSKFKMYLLLQFSSDWAKFFSQASLVNCQELDEARFLIFKKNFFFNFFEKNKVLLLCNGGCYGNGIIKSTTRA